MSLTKQTIAKRRKICGICPYRRDNFSFLGIPIAKEAQCKLCGCLIDWKTEVQSENCPKNYWKHPEKLKSKK